MTELIYCAAKNKQYPPIALELGMSYGARLPDPVYFKPTFVDNDYEHPDRVAYMAALKVYRPRVATVLDWEREEQYPEVLSWAWEAARYVSEAVIIIPKVHGGIRRLPRTIAGKSVRLGYSIPTEYGGTEVWIEEFKGWPVHALGGSMQAQWRLGRMVNVVSADGNMVTEGMGRGQFFMNGVGDSRTNRWSPQLKEVGLGHLTDIPAHIFRLTVMNTWAMWLDCEAGLRYAVESDLPQIEKIARSYPKELGYIRRVALKEAIERFELYVAVWSNNEVGGFVHWHRRRDGWSTVYEIAVAQKWRGLNLGRALINAIPRPTRLKCTIDNPANSFYECVGFRLARTEAGRKRALNVWER
jgi:GNAT superfamily N-acetyltransferase